MWVRGLALSLQRQAPQTQDPMAAKGQNRAKSAKQARTQRTRAKGGNLIPAKKGEVRNPKGVNGWTKAQEHVKAELAKSSPKLLERALSLAESGDATMLRTLLAPLLPAQETKHTHEGEVSLRWQE